MVAVSLVEATKRFGETMALDSVSLQIRSGEFFFLLGPSGCGKTTLLRAVAGLGPLDEGDVIFDDRKMNDVPPHKRNTSLVFQNYALWPHMTVFDNVAYGLVERKISKAERKKRVSQVLELVRLEHTAERRPSEMSGGQQQRVALARALVVEPDVVLLDEPLSNLDAHLRNEMRYELKRIQSETGVTMIYVTHDQKEALAMAHTIAVLKDGRLRQVGGPEDLYQNPGEVFVAEFVGRTNLVKGTISDKQNGYLHVNTEIGSLWGRASSAKNIDKFAREQSVTCSIRPEAVRSSPPPSSDGRKNGGTDTDTAGSTNGEKPRHAELEARLLKRLFMGEIEERFYAINDLQIQAVEPAPRGSPPLPNEAFNLYLSPDEVVVLENKE